MEVAAHDVADSFQAGKIKAVQCGQPQLPQAAMEMPVQYPAGSPADQGDVHCHNETHKCRVAAFIDGSDQVLIGFLTEAFQCNDLITVTVKVVEILIGFQGTELDKLIQCRLGKPPDVHGFLICEVDKTLKDAAATFRIVTVERLHHASFVTGPGIDACGLPTARAGLRYHVLIVPTVQIFLHMGDDHVTFADQDAASRVQLQPFDEGQVVEACPGYPTAVNLHCIKQCNRRNLTGAPCLPFNRPEDRFIGIILKFEGNAIVVMVSCPAQACGIGKAVIPHHHPVDGDV